MQQAKSEKILEILSRKNLFDLVDGEKVVRQVTQRAMKGEKGIAIRLIFHARRLFKTVQEKFGLNPGSDFEKWISAELTKVDINNLGDLKKRMSQLPAGLKNVDGGNVEGIEPKLAIIAADVITHTKVEFPQMAELYFAKPDEVSPARLVRASMSIPLFFEPVTLSPIPGSGSEKHPAWIKHCRYFGKVPPKVSFVDGGMLSNFPINVFHRSDGGVPRKPTFGARLSTYRETYSDLGSLTSFFGAMISSMRQIYDYDFL
jgi:NTE family protein